MAHTLAIADLYVALHQVAARNEPGTVQLVDLQTEPNCWRRWTGYGGSRQLLRPDLYLAAHVGPDELRWFIEVDRGTEHRPALLRKCHAYQAYYDSRLEQDRDGVFPKVAWLVPEVGRAAHLRQAIVDDHQLLNELFEVDLLDCAAARLLQ